MRCPGKINLFLKVTAKRQDGYHELETLFLPLAAPADTLELTDGAPGIRCKVDGAEIPDNLVCRSAQIYAKAAGLDPACDFTLDKHIPIAAGLGGGSSDAAGALLLLNERYQRFSLKELAKIAVGLGADVPFFLNPKPEWATGIGEIRRPLPGTAKLPPVLVINPLFPVSARWAYTHLAPENIGPADPVQIQAAEQALIAGDWPELARHVHNDLGIALFHKFPLLRLLRDFTNANGALATEVSGSGSSLFSLCSNAEACQSLAQALKAEFGNTTLRTFVSCSTGD